jgi:hypothetical protein
MSVTNEGLLDTGQGNEVYLEILSFAGGEDQVSEDHVTPTNKGRVMKNWEPLSIGGMQRVAGINEVGDIPAGGAVTADDPSLLGLFHYNESNKTSAVLGVVDGDLVILSGSDILVASGGTSLFTADKECFGCDVGDKAWITNSTDNLKMFDTTNGAETPTDVPASPREGIYYHKSRLFAEGGGRTVYSSRAGAGNWPDEADAWSKSNDASNIDLPDYTKGSLPGLPSGDEIAVFTKAECYSVFGFPNVAYRKIVNSWGCANRKTLAEGNGGAFGVSQFPNKCVWYWDRTKFISLTEGVSWIDDVNFAQEMYGLFRENKYYFIYTSGASGTYPNTVKIFDTRFACWYEREINPDVGDNLGAPVVLGKQNNEFYCWSSRIPNLYEIETGTEDEGYNTECDYKTKNFTSRDFSLSGSGKPFPIDEVTIKLTKIRVQFYGQTDDFTILWSADDGVNQGSLSFGMTTSGAKLNVDFTINTSSLAAIPPDQNQSQSVSNNAVGKKFYFQILHNGKSTRPRVKKIKIYGLLLEED